jgi:putative phosphoesterase
MKLGILSDTHGFLDPRIPELFAGVDHILHAGDIGYASIILELETIAPVTAVIGNTDAGLDFRETEAVQLGLRKFLVRHIVNPHAPDLKLHSRLLRDRPDAVVFGHTHRMFCQTVGRTLFFNPGYAGKPKYNTERSVALLHCDEQEIRAEYLPL